MVKPAPEEVQRVRTYIAAVRWQFAKTYALTWPHDYTIRKWDLDKEDDFEFFVIFIRKYGYPERFLKQKRIYYNLDGYKYWTMGAPLRITIVINRAVIGSKNHERQRPEGH